MVQSFTHVEFYFSIDVIAFCKHFLQRLHQFGTRNVGFNGSVRAVVRPLYRTQLFLVSQPSSFGHVQIVNGKISTTVGRLPRLSVPSLTWIDLFGLDGRTVSATVSANAIFERTKRLQRSSRLERLDSL